MDETIKGLQQVADLIDRIATISPEAGETLKRSLGDVNMRTSVDSIKTAGVVVSAQQQETITLGAASLDNLFDAVKNSSMSTSQFSQVVHGVATMLQEVKKVMADLQNLTTGVSSSTATPTASATAPIKISGTTPAATSHSKPTKDRDALNPSVLVKVHELVMSIVEPAIAGALEGYSFGTEVSHPDDEYLKTVSGYQLTSEKKIRLNIQAVLKAFKAQRFLPYDPYEKVMRKDGSVMSGRNYSLYDSELQALLAVVAHEVSHAFLLSDRSTTEAEFESATRLTERSVFKRLFPDLKPPRLSSTVARFKRSQYDREDSSYGLRLLEATPAFIDSLRLDADQIELVLEEAQKELDKRARKLNSTQKVGMLHLQQRKKELLAGKQPYQEFQTNQFVPFGPEARKRFGIPYTPPPPPDPVKTVFTEKSTSAPPKPAKKVIPSSVASTDFPAVITTLAASESVKVGNSQFKEMFKFDPLTVEDQSKKLIAFKKLMQQFSDILTTGGKPVPEAVQAVLQPTQADLFKSVYRDVKAQNPLLSGADLNKEVEAEIRRVYRRAVGNLLGSVGFVDPESDPAAAVPTVAAIGNLFGEGGAVGDEPFQVSKDQGIFLLRQARRAIDVTTQLLKKGRAIPEPTADVVDNVVSTFSNLALQMAKGEYEGTTVGEQAPETAEAAVAVSKRFASTRVGAESFKQNLQTGSEFGGSQIVGFEPSVVFPVGFEERVVKQAQKIFDEAQKNIAENNLTTVQINGNAVSLPAILAKNLFSSLRTVQQATNLSSVMGGEVTTGKSFSSMFGGHSADSSALNLFIADLIKQYTSSGSLESEYPKKFARSQFGALADEEKTYSTPADLLIQGLLENLDRDAIYQEKIAYEASNELAREVANKKARQIKQQIAYVKKLISSETTDQERAFLLTGYSGAAKGVTVQGALASLFGVDATASVFPNFGPGVVNYARQLQADLKSLGNFSSRRPYETQSSAVRVADAVARQIDGEAHQLAQLVNLKNLTTDEFEKSAQERSVGGQPFAAFEFFSDYFGLGVQRGDRGGSLASAFVASSYLDAEGNFDRSKLEEQYAQNPEMTRRNLQAIYYGRSEVERRDIPLVRIAELLQNTSPEKRAATLEELATAAPGIAELLSNPAIFSKILKAQKNPTGAGQLTEVLSAIAPALQAGFVGYIARSGGLSFEEAHKLLSAKTVSPEFAPIANFFKSLTAKNLKNPGSNLQQGLSFIQQVDTASYATAADYSAAVLGEEMVQQLADIRIAQQPDESLETLANERYAIVQSAANLYKEVSGSYVSPRLRKIQELTTRRASLETRAEAYPLNSPARADLEEQQSALDQQLITLFEGKPVMETLLSKLTNPRLTEADRESIVSEIATREYVHQLTGGYDVAVSEGFGNDPLLVRAQRKAEYLRLEKLVESGQATEADYAAFAQAEKQRNYLATVAEGSVEVPMLDQVAFEVKGHISSDPNEDLTSSYRLDPYVADLIKGTPLVNYVKKVEKNNEEYLRSEIDLDPLFFAGKKPRYTLSDDSTWRTFDHLTEDTREKFKLYSDALTAEQAEAAKKAPARAEALTKVEQQKVERTAAILANLFATDPHAKELEQRKNAAQQAHASAVELLKTQRQKIKEGAAEAGSDKSLLEQVKIARKEAVNTTQEYAEYVMPIIQKDSELQRLQEKQQRILYTDARYNPSERTKKKTRRARLMYAQAANTEKKELDKYDKARTVHKFKYDRNPASLIDIFSDYAQMLRYADLLRRQFEHWQMAREYAHDNGLVTWQDAEKNEPYMQLFKNAKTADEDLAKYRETMRVKGNSVEVHRDLAVLRDIIANDSVYRAIQRDTGYDEPAMMSLLSNLQISQQVEEGGLPEGPLTGMSPEAIKDLALTGYIQNQAAVLVPSETEEQVFATLQKFARKSKRGQKLTTAEEIERTYARDSLNKIFARKIARTFGDSPQATNLSNMLSVLIGEMPPSFLLDQNDPEAVIKDTTITRLLQLFGQLDERTFSALSQIDPTNLNARTVDRILSDLGTDSVEASNVSEFVDFLLEANVGRALAINPLNNLIAENRALDAALGLRAEGRKTGNILVFDLETSVEKFGKNPKIFQYADSEGTIRESSAGLSTKERKELANSMTKAAVQGTQIVGHNIAAFDLPYLYGGAENVPASVKKMTVDTLEMARELGIPGSHTLSGLARFFGIGVQKQKLHTAEYDISLNKRVYAALLNQQRRIREDPEKAKQEMNERFIAQLAPPPPPIPFPSDRPSRSSAVFKVPTSEDLKARKKRKIEQKAAKREKGRRAYRDKLSKGIITTPLSRKMLEPVPTTPLIPPTTPLKPVPTTPLSPEMLEPVPTTPLSPEMLEPVPTTPLSPKMLEPVPTTPLSPEELRDVSLGLWRNPPKKWVITPTKVLAPTPASPSTPPKTKSIPADYNPQQQALARFERLPEKEQKAQAARLSYVLGNVRALDLLNNAQLTSSGRLVLKDYEGQLIKGDEAANRLYSFFGISPDKGFTPEQFADAQKRAKAVTSAFADYRVDGNFDRLAGYFTTAAGAVGAASKRYTPEALEIVELLANEMPEGYMGLLTDPLSNIRTYPRRKTGRTRLGRFNYEAVARTAAFGTRAKDSGSLRRQRSGFAKKAKEVPVVTAPSSASVATTPLASVVTAPSSASVATTPLASVATTPLASVATTPLAPSSLSESGTGGGKPPGKGRGKEPPSDGGFMGGGGGGGGSYRIDSSGSLSFRGPINISTLDARTATFSASKIEIAASNVAIQIQKGATTGIDVKQIVQKGTELPSRRGAPSLLNIQQNTGAYSGAGTQTVHAGAGTTFVGGVGGGGGSYFDSLMSNKATLDLLRSQFKNRQGRFAGVDRETARKLLEQETQNFTLTALKEMQPVEVLDTAKYTGTNPDGTLTPAEALRQSIQSQIAEITDPTNIDAVTANFSERIVRLAENITELEKLLVEAATTEEQRVNITSDLRDINNKLRDVSAETRNTTTVTTQDAAEAKREEDAAARTARIDAEAAARTARMDAEAAARRAATDARRPNEAELLSRGVLSATRTAFDLSGGMLRTGNFAAGRAQLIQQTADTLREATGLQRVMNSLGSITGSSSAAVAEFSNRVLAVNNAAEAGNLEEMAQALVELVSNAADLQQEIATAPDLTEEQRSALLEPLSAFSARASQADYIKPTAGVIETVERKNLNVLEEQLQAAASRPSFLGIGRDRSQRRALSEYAQMRFGEAGANLIYNERAMRFQARTENGGRIDLTEASSSDLNRLREDLAAAGTPIGLEELQQLQRVMAKVQQTRNQTPFADPIFFLSSRIRDLQTLGQTAMSVLNFPQTAAGLIEQTASPALNAVRSMTALRGLSRDQSTFNRAMGAASQQQALFGGSLTSNIGSITSFVPLANTYGIDISKVVNVARKLAAFDPAQGMEGASIAIKEFLSGNVASLSRRFEINRSALSKINAGDATDMLDSLDALLSGMGVTDQLINEAANSRAAQYDKMLGRLETLGIRVSEELVTQATPFLDSILGSTSALGRQAEQLTITRMRDESLKFAGNKGLVDAEGKSRLDKISLFAGSSAEFTKSVDEVFAAANTEVAAASAQYQLATGITPLVEPYRMLENMKPEERIRFRALAQQYALFNQMTPEQAILQASRDVGGDYASYQEFINQRKPLQQKRLTEAEMRKDPQFLELRRNAELELARQASQGNTLGLGVLSSGRIERVLDADTVKIAGRKNSARLLGIDAPEKSSKDSANAVVQAVEIGLAKNENITFQIAGQDDKGRDLIIAYNEQGQMINSELLARGAVSAFGGPAVEALANFVADQGIGIVNQQAAALGLGGLPTISEEARQQYYMNRYFGGVLGSASSVGSSAVGGAAMYGGINWLATSAAAPTNAFTSAMVGGGGLGLTGFVGLGALAGLGLYAGGTALYDRNDTSVAKMRELMKIQQELNKEAYTRRQFEAAVRQTSGYTGLTQQESAQLYRTSSGGRGGRGGRGQAKQIAFEAQTNATIAAYEELTPKMEKLYNEQDDAAKAVLNAVVATPFGAGGAKSIQQGLQEALAIISQTPENQQKSEQYRQAARFAEVAYASINNADLLSMAEKYNVGVDLSKIGLSDARSRQVSVRRLSQQEISKLTAPQANKYFDELRRMFESPATYQVEAKQYTDQQFEERMQRRQKGFSTFMEQLALNNAMGLFGGKPLSGAQLANRQFNKSTFLAAGLYDPNAQTALKTAAEESVKAFDDVSKYNKQMAETMAPYVTAFQTTFANYANAFKRAGDGADQLRDYLSNGDPMFALNEMRRISGLDWRSLVNQQMFLPQTSQSALFTQLPYLGVQSQLQRPSPMVAQGIDRLNGYQMPFTSGPRGRLAYANSILNNSSVTSLMNPSEMLNLFNMGIQAQTEMAQRNMQYNIQMRDMALNHNRQLEDITRNAFRQLEGIHLNATRQMVQAVQQRELTKRQSLAQTYSQLGSADISEADRRRIDSTAQAAKKFADQAEQSNPAAFLRYEGRYTSENTQLLDQAFAAYDATPVTDLAKRDSTWKTVMKYRDLVVAELEKEMQTADPARKASLQAQRALLGRDPERGAQAQAFADQQISTLMQQAENRKALEKRRDDLMRQKQYSGLEYQSLMQNLQQAQQTGDPLQIQQATRALADFNFQQKALDNELQLVNRQLKNLIDVAPLWSDFWTEGYTQIENTTSTTMSGLINQYEDFNINLKQQIQDALLNLARQKEDVVRSFTDAATEIAQQVPATMAKGLSAILTYTTQMQGVEAAMSQGKFDLANSLAYAANSTLAQALYGDANSPEGKALKDQLAVDASARNVPGSLDMYSVDTPLGKALRVFTVTQASPPSGPTPFPQPSGLGVFTP